jgi:hypothetical protein
MTAQNNLVTEETSNEQVIKEYKEAKEIVSAKDFIRWRDRVKHFPARIQTELVEWRKRYTKVSFKDYNEVNAAVDEVVAKLAPMFAFALAGVESADEKFTNQRFLLDNLLDIPHWDYSGLAVTVELPNTLAYVYQGLHGALCMNTMQYQLALDLVDFRIERSRDSKYYMLWELHDIMGWPETLGGTCTNAWRYLSAGADRWLWLNEVFGSSHEFKASLAAYYMALNVHELAWRIARTPESDIRFRGRLDLHIPLCFMEEQPPVRRSAFRLLVRHPSSVDILWASANVSRSQVEHHWADWLEECNRWLNQAYRFRLSDDIAHADLFKVI